MNEIEKRNSLLIQQFNYINKNLIRSKRYKEYVQYFFMYLEEHTFKLGFNGFVSYYNFLNTEYKNGHFEVSTFNVRLCSAKTSIKFLFEKSPYSTDMAKEFKLDRVLSSYKCKKKSSKFVDKDKYLTPKEIKEFIKKCPDITISLIVEFIFKTACRISEVTNILLTDIDKVNDHYEITIRGKGEKSRKVKVSIGLIEKIKRHFNSEKWLFEHEHIRIVKDENGNKTEERIRERKGYSPINLTNRFNKYVHIILKKDKDMRFRCHTLRHSALTFLLDKGANLKKISRLAGHSTIAVTANLYLHSEFEYKELKNYYEGF